MQLRMIVNYFETRAVIIFERKFSMLFKHELTRTTPTSSINGLLELCLEKKGPSYLKISANGTTKIIEFKTVESSFKPTAEIVDEIYKVFTPTTMDMELNFFTAKDLFLFIADSVAARARTEQAVTSYEQKVRHNAIEFFAALNLAIAACAPQDEEVGDQDGKNRRIKEMVPNVTAENAERIIENAVQPISIVGPEFYPAEHYFTDNDTKQRFQDRMTQLFNLEPAIAMIILSNTHVLRDYLQGTSFQAISLAEKTRNSSVSLSEQQNQHRISITRDLVEAKIESFSEYLSELIKQKSTRVIGPEVRTFFSSIGLPPTKDQLQQLSSKMTEKPQSDNIGKAARDYITDPKNPIIYEPRNKVEKFISYSLAGHPEKHKLLQKAEHMLKSNEQRCEVIRARETLLKQKDHKFFPAIEQLTQEQRQNLAKAFLTRKPNEINELLQHPDRVLQVVLYGWPENGEWLVRSIDEMKIPVPPTHEQRRELEELFIRMMKLVFAFPVDLGEEKQKELIDGLWRENMPPGIKDSKIKTQYSHGGAQAECLHRLVLSKELTVVNAKRHAGIFSGKRTALQMKVQTVAERLLNEANQYVYATKLPSDRNLLTQDKKNWATAGKLLDRKAHHDAFGEAESSGNQKMMDQFFTKGEEGKFDDKTEYDTVLYEVLTLLRACAVAAGKDVIVATDANLEQKKVANKTIYDVVRLKVCAIQSINPLFSASSQQLFDHKGKKTHYDIIARLGRRLDSARDDILAGKFDIALVMAISVLESEFVTDKVPHAQHRHDSVENVLRIAYTLASDGQLERAQKVLEQAIEHPYFQVERHWTQRFNPARLWKSNKSVTESVATLQQELAILKSFAKNYMPPPPREDNIQGIVILPRITRHDYATILN